MNELALFAGAGGGILGGHLLGWRTVCAVEYNAYARSVLLARQNDGTLPPFPIWDDVRTFDGRPWRGIAHVVSGGFPCQDISAAGRGDGLDGERSGLWTEMARIVGEVRPRYVYVENSPVLTSRGLGRVLGDLAAMGFDAEWGVVGAADVGAQHQRDRIWIVAHSQLHRVSERRGITAAVSQVDFARGISGDERSGLQQQAGTVLAYSDCRNVEGIERGSVDTKDGPQPREHRLDYAVEGDGRNGRLNPEWIEWLMGWPIGWTELKPLATGRFQEWLQQHSIYSHEDKEAA